MPVTLRDENDAKSSQPSESDPGDNETYWQAEVVLLAKGAVDAGNATPNHAEQSWPAEELPLATNPTNATDATNATNALLLVTALHTLFTPSVQMEAF